MELLGGAKFRAQWCVAITIIVACGLSSCTSGGNDQGDGEPGDDGGVTDEPARVESGTASAGNYYDGPPRLDAEHMALAPRPGVLALTQDLANEALVQFDRIIFAREGHDEVLAWEAGQVIAAPPAEGKGRYNPFGFAREVMDVSVQDDRIIVLTTSVGLDALFSGTAKINLNDSIAPDLSHFTRDELLEVVTKYYPQEAGTPGLGDFALRKEPRPTSNDPAASGTGATERRDLNGAGQRGFFDWVEDTWDDATDVVEDGWDVVVTTAEAVYDTIVNLLSNQIKGSDSISAEVSGSYKGKLFAVETTKTFREGTSTPITVFIKGRGDVDATGTFAPSAQISFDFPVIPGTRSYKVGLTVDGKATAKAKFKLDVEAGLKSAGGEDASELGPELLPEVLPNLREALLGPNVEPPGGWTKVLYVSEPTTKTIFVGAVPVVLVSTRQLNLECGFEIRGGVNATINIDATASALVEGSFDSSDGFSTETDYGFTSTHTTQLTARGSAVASCGLVPRVNVFVYDSIGLFGGVRTSLVGKASYDEECPENSVSTRPVGEAALGLYVNGGIKAGYRIQAPGSTTSGISALDQGMEDSTEVWNDEWPIWTRTYPVKRGIGYCTSACSNSRKDAIETDVDCGDQCGACDVGEQCKRNSDCKAELSCHRGTGRCSTDFCGDLSKSPKESDVDCGGSCSKCGDGKQCTRAEDCVSGYCIPDRFDAAGKYVASQCAATSCQTRAQDGDETGVDCGGSCRKCRLGERTSNPADCANPYWNFATQRCVATACYNGVKDPGEGDVDCGGACGACGPGKGCTERSDCRGSLVCANGTCAQSSCSDGVKGDDELGVDCGDVCGLRCQLGEACRYNEECLSLSCRAGLCREPVCFDGAMNGDETDVDCGARCTDCRLHKGCRENGDCQSGICSPTLKRCTDRVEPCFDGIRNRGESDVDCGANACVKCGTQRACSTNADCGPELLCDPALRVCLPGTCKNGRRDASSPYLLQREADVDCGGLCSPLRCRDGRQCTRDDDCESRLCARSAQGSGVCASQCGNGRLDPGETGVDCGGNCPRKCGIGARCLSSSDCAAGACVTNVCTASDSFAPRTGTGLTFSQVLPRSVFLSWGPAQDDRTAQQALEYQVVRASLAQQIDSVPEAVAVPSQNVVLPFASGRGRTSITAAGLEPKSTTAFAVLVRDAGGNLALYTPRAVTTPSCSASGTVKGAANGLPISGVSVTASTGGSTVTDAQGRYQIEVACSTATISYQQSDYLSDKREFNFNVAPVLSNQNVSLVSARGCTLSGAVKDARSTQPIAGARVQLATGGELVTGANGEFELSAPCTSSVDVSFGATGYRSASARYDLASTPQRTGLEISLEPTARCSVSGTIRNAINGTLVPNASIQIAGGASATADANGAYSVAAPCASVVLTYQAASYASQNRSLDLTTASQTGQDVTLVPSDVSTGWYLFVLTWAGTPQDLDSYLRTSTTKLNYQAKGGLTASPYAQLDVDDTDGYGPETFRIEKPTNTADRSTTYGGTFRYYVQDYESTGFGARDAVVRIFKDGELLETYAMPTTGPGNYWHVFDMAGDGTITLVNALSNSEPGAP